METQTQNLTISLPKSLVKKVKVLAARRETSISALLATSLEKLVDEDEGYEPARRRMLERARDGFDLGTGGHIEVERGELHER